MIFGYSTNAFVKYSLEESLEKIAGLGFKGVEIMCDAPHLYPPEYDAQALDKLKGTLEKLDLKVTNLNSFTLFAVGDTYLPSWIEPEKERRQIRIRHTLDCINIAAFLGCANISIPPGGPLGSIARKDGIRRFHEGLEAVIPQAESSGVKVLIEPEPDLMIENTSEFKSFIKDVQSPWVGINFDIGHFFCAGEAPDEAFETLFSWVGHVHIEDIGADRVHNHLIPGLGAIDFFKIFTVMKRLGYQGDISLELYPYVDTPVAAGKDGLRHLAPVFKKSGLLDLE